LNKPPFRVLRQTLLDLGFHEVPQQRARYRFEHPESETYFIFRPFKDEELVDLPNLVAVRHLLYLRGVIEDEAVFDKMLQERSLAG
jgi:hypothetical protein